MLFLLLGSTCGLVFRMFVKYRLKIKAGFYINNISLINFSASLFLGVLVALNPISKNILLLFYVGILGSFSTFSSFIYQLFVLLQNRQYKLLFLHYIEVILLSFIFFYLGYYLIQIFQK